jgi:hypothetical protein
MARNRKKYLRKVTIKRFGTVWIHFRKRVETEGTVM